MDERRYVLISYPVHRKGHKYYGCKISCPKCSNGWTCGEFYHALHCYKCNANMLLDEFVGLSDDPGYNYINDAYVICTNCFNSKR